MFESVPSALNLLFTPTSLGILVLAGVIGLIVAVIPGIGNVQAMALLMPLMFVMETHHALIFLVALLGTGGFAGSITAIIMNVPGEAPNAATALDGYPMSQQGRAGEAIGASAAASALGALFGVTLLVASIPVLRAVVLSFGPPELFALSIAGIAMISSVTADNPFRGLIAGMAGCALAMIGFSTALGGARFTFGQVVLLDGVPLVPLVIGLFGIPEMVNLLARGESISGSATPTSKGALSGVLAVLRNPVCLIRSSAIGVWVGLVPGIGGSVAPWVAYYASVNSSRSPETFGRGNVLGVIAPEASNDSKDGGALMTLLALGIPGSLTTALLLSAFTFLGINPGQRLLTQQMHYVWLIICTLIIINVGSSVVGVAVSSWLVRITAVPPTILAPIVLVLCLIGGFASEMSWYAMMVVIASGLVGIAMVQLDFPRPPLLIGFILFPIIENNLHISLQIYRGELAFLLRPITLVVLVIGTASILWPVVARRRRRARLPVATVVSTITDEAEPEAPAFTPVLALLVMVAGLSFFLAELPGMRDDRRLVPLLILGCLAVTTIVQCVISAVAWHRHRGSWWARRTTRYPFWWPVLWLTLLPALLWLFGFVVGIAAYVAAFEVMYGRLRSDAQHRASTVLLTSLGTALLVYVLFDKALAIALPNGWLLAALTS